MTKYDMDTLAETAERSSCVQGYHVYRAIWDAVIGEDLVCERETTNEHDRYAVAVVKDGVIIGHLPRTISRPCSLFLRRENSIMCRVIGHRRYSAYLPQGGLEIPCVLRFAGKLKEITKIKKFVKPTL